MFPKIVSLIWAIGIATAIANAPLKTLNISENQTHGFHSPILSFSSNGSAICVTGDVPVHASTDRNLKLNLPSLDNQTVITGIANDMFTAGSTFLQDIRHLEYQTVSGTYNISCKICYPVESKRHSSSVEFLTHGIGFDKGYWDAAPGFSYVDAAAARGYTTFMYDRLGVGLSTHPEDADAVVQAPLQLSIAHNLIQMLRSGSLSSTSYSHVIGIGHSFGSVITQGVTNTYPKDLDAAVLTGFALDAPGIVSFASALGLSIARETDPIRFSTLSNSYLVPSTYSGFQFAYFKAQGFPIENLALAELRKQTTTVGELYTIPSIQKVASEFTGPIDLVNGANDWPFCMGNCSFPTIFAGALKAALFPAASNSSSYYLAANAGHALNLHYTAGLAYEHIQDFVESHGF